MKLYNAFWEPPRVKYHLFIIVQCNWSKLSPQPPVCLFRLCAGGQQLCPGAAVPQPVHLYGHSGPLQQQTPAGSAQRTPPQRHRAVSPETQPQQLFDLFCIFHHLHCETILLLLTRMKISGTLVHCLFKPRTYDLSQKTAEKSTLRTTTAFFVIYYHQERTKTMLNSSKC